MSDAVVLFDVGADGVAVVTLNRPDRLNIYNLAMRDALIEAFTAARDHPDARALVLRANGPHFSAGADLKEFGTAETIFEARRIRWDRDPWNHLWELPLPTVAALHGYALGAGLEMALLCDIRMAAPDTVLGLPETSLGMLPSAGATQSLTRVVAPGAALPVILLAEQMAAALAHRRGIVTAVVDDVDAAAHRMAAQAASFPQAAVAAATRALRLAADLPLAAGLIEENALAQLCRASFGAQSDAQRTSRP